MADRRSVRASSRRKTPTVQIPTKPTSPPVARAPRGRALRSASRDLPDVAKPTKPTRRKARQMSAATATDESEGEKKPTRGSKRKPAKEAPKGQFSAQYMLFENPCANVVFMAPCDRSGK